MREGIDTSLANGYFQYLCDLIGADTLVGGKYRILLKTLHGTEFYWLNERDENRARDGEYLRVRYFYELNPSSENYEDFLDFSCSVFEMMVALAMRIESDIMLDWRPNTPDRTGEWFWLMVGNLDLLKCTDDRFDGNTLNEIHHKLDIFMERKCDKNGIGGLFPLKIGTKNQKNVEIWYQMQAYFQENFL